MFPFCFGESVKRCEKSGSIVPSMAAIMPYTKMAKIAATMSMDILQSITDLKA